jgi:predicted RNA-binding Zn-ribbon protein involved in translation (DUF1610 family)
MAHVSAEKLTNLLRVAVSSKSAAELKEFVSSLSDATKAELMDALSPVEESMRKFQCPTCGKGFERKWNMDRHIEMRHAKKEFSCAFVGCAKVFKTDQALQDHQQTEHGLSAPTKRARVGIKHDDHFDLLVPSSGMLLHMGEHGVEEREIERSDAKE